MAWNHVRRATFQIYFTPSSHLIQTLGHKKNGCSLEFFHGRMVGNFQPRVDTDLIINCFSITSRTLCLSPDGKLAATFARSQYFEVRELKTKAIKTMQVPIISTKSKPAGHHRDRMQLAVKKQPVTFAHGGFAIVGASNESRVHVWDVKRGDRLISLDHGG
jgi:hypothetical protein